MATLDETLAQAESLEQNINQLNVAEQILSDQEDPNDPDSAYKKDIKNLKDDLTYYKNKRTALELRIKNLREETIDLQNSNNKIHLFTTSLLNNTVSDTGDISKAIGKIFGSADLSEEADVVAGMINDAMPRLGRKEAITKLINLLDLDWQAPVFAVGESRKNFIGPQDISSLDFLGKVSYICGLQISDRSTILTLLSWKLDELNLILDGNFFNTEVPMKDRLEELKKKREAAKEAREAEIADRKEKLRFLREQIAYLQQIQQAYLQNEELAETRLKARYFDMEPDEYAAAVKEMAMRLTKEDLERQEREKQEALNSRKSVVESRRVQQTPAPSTPPEKLSQSRASRVVSQVEERYEEIPIEERAYTWRREPFQKAQQIVRGFWNQIRGQSQKVAGKVAKKAVTETAKAGAKAATTAAVDAGADTAVAATGVGAPVAAIMILAELALAALNKIKDWAIRFIRDPEFRKQLLQKGAFLFTNSLILAKIFIDFFATNWLGAGLGSILSVPLIPALGPFAPIAGAFLGAQVQSSIVAGMSAATVEGTAAISAFGGSTIMGAGVLLAGIFSPLLLTLLMTIPAVLASLTPPKTETLGQTATVAFTVKKHANFQVIDGFTDELPVTYSYVITNGDSPITVTDISDEIVSSKGGDKIKVSLSKPDEEIATNAASKEYTYSALIKGDNFKDALVTNTLKITAKTKEGNTITIPASYTITIGKPPPTAPYGFPMAGKITTLDAEIIKVNLINHVHYSCFLLPDFPGNCMNGDQVKEIWQGGKGMKGGIDIAPQTGLDNTVYTTVSGKVEKAEWNDDVGGIVYIRSSDGQYIIEYQHLNIDKDFIDTYRGKNVAAGVRIGQPYPDKLPVTSGPHVHYQIIQKNGSSYINVNFADEVGDCHSGFVLPDLGETLHDGMVIKNAGPDFGCSQTTQSF